MSEIDELRKKMETITLEMIKLLEARTDIAEKIGKIKNDLGISVTDESREVELREKIIAECKTLKLDEKIGTRFLNFLLNLKTKMILRISGIPKLNFIRNLFWKIVLDKTHLITSPTIATLQDLKQKNFNPNKLAAVSAFLN